jgi:hypothetical protein
MPPVQEKAPSADGSDQPGSRQPAGDCKDIEMQLEDVHMKNLIDPLSPICFLTHMQIRTMCKKGVACLRLLIICILFYTISM